MHLIKMALKAVSRLFYRFITHFKSQQERKASQNPVQNHHQLATPFGDVRDAVQVVK